MLAQAGCLLLARSVRSLSTSSVLSAATYKEAHTDYLLTDDQLELRDAAEKFAQKEIAPLAAQIDKTDHFPMHLWKKLGDAGLHGIRAPPEYGGLGLTYLDHLLVSEQISRASSSVGLSWGCHSQLCIDAITRVGTPEQKKKYLPDLIAGDKIGALNMSEPGAGSDVMGMRCKAELQSDGSWILNGSKMWCTNGPDVDTLCVFARSGSAGKITGFIVERGFPGFSNGPNLDKFGHRGSHTSEMIFNNCRVPPENVLGVVDKGGHILMSGLVSERIVFIGFPLGLQQSVVDLVLPYTHERKQFGQRIAEFQMVQKALANIWGNLGASRSYAYSVALKVSKKHERVDVKDANAMAAFVSDKAQEAARWAVQLLGGNGYTNDYDAGRLMRDSMLYTIGGGTNQIREWLVGREINDMFPKDQ